MFFGIVVGCAAALALIGLVEMFRAPVDKRKDITDTNSDEWDQARRY